MDGYVFIPPQPSLHSGEQSSRGDPQPSQEKKIFHYRKNYKGLNLPKQFDKEWFLTRPSQAETLHYLDYLQLKMNYFVRMSSGVSEDQSDNDAYGPYDENSTKLFKLQGELQTMHKSLVDEVKGVFTFRPSRAKLYGLLMAISKVEGHMPEAMMSSGQTHAADTEVGSDIETSLQSQALSQSQDSKSVTPEQTTEDSNSDSDSEAAYRTQFRNRLLGVLENIDNLTTGPSPPRPGKTPITEASKGDETKLLAAIETFYYGDNEEAEKWRTGVDVLESFGGTTEQLDPFAG